MNKGHKLLSLLLCAAVLLTLISPAALAEGETLPENEVVLSKTPAASAAQEGASGEAAEETPAPQATPRPQESQAADESPETTPAESPAESPKESPVESPKESPAESPKESPAQTPAGEFTISYDYNGGAAGALLMLNAGQNGENAAQNGENAAPAPAAESVTGNSGQKIVLANAPIKPERDFAGWKSTLTGKQYAAGESYEIQGNDTLVAQWNMLSVLEIDAQPQEGSTLLACEKTISAISEDEQALVEQAIKNAQPTTGDALTLSAFEPEVLASDVSFIGADGKAQQPAAGETVPMTVTVPAGAMEGEGFWMVYHLTENGEGGYIATPVQFMPADANGASVQLAADGFSIYAVAKVHDTEGDAVAEGSAIEMPVESSKVFYYKDDQYSQYTYHRYTWTIENNNDIVKGYATPMSDLTESLNRYQYPWLSVDALREGTVTVKLNYYYYNGNSWWSPTGTPVSGSIAFTIKVTEPTGLRIVNNIVENGTLKPVYVDKDGNIQNDLDLTYIWSAQFFHTDNSGDETEIKDEDSSIDLDAVYDDGSLNVAIDNGGIREETDINGKEVLHVTTYTVTAYDKDGKEVGKASHRVEFGGNVLNGSFEYPAIPSGSTNYAFANGTHQLFWRTTAPGPNHMLGQDVELGNGNPGNPYLQDGSAAHGKQYAELNAEAMGTLYQDVLTAPGAELSWGFSHRSRKYTGENTMYLIIASSKDGAKIDTQAQINDLIRNYNADGKKVIYDDGSSYTLWKMEGDANHWQNHFGSYKVPPDQYATRFFFASATGTTTGNLIDNVTFNQEQRYIIEYYLNGEKVDGLTETKTAEVNTTVSPKNLASDKLKNAILTDSTINGEPYGGETMTILPRPDVDTTHRDCRNVLRLYFVTGAITVRKVVTIENWNDLTDAEREELGYNKSYVAKFELYKDVPGEEGQKVAEASISFDQIDQSPKTGVAQFMKLNPDGSKEPYKPQANTAYWVKEVNVSTETPLYAYGLTTTYAPNADGISDGSFTTDEQANGSVTVTNAYALHLFDLTIKTSGVKPIDENQTYIYRVHGNDAHTKLIDLTVAIHGDGQATVKNLPSGQYKVTQVNAWSWRYTPDQTAERSVTLNANGTVVEYKQTRAHEGDAGNKWKWLNGQHWIDNRWKDGSSSGGVPGDEGGDENSIKD